MWLCTKFSRFDHSQNLSLHAITCLVRRTIFIKPKSVSLFVQVDKLLLFLVTRFRLAIWTVCIGNRMYASAFRDIWARVMFLKFSKLHEPQASAI